VHAARLFAARNEFESFQIVLRADAAGASDVDIDISDLRASHGREISRNNITIYAERFIDLSRASASEGSAGEWPDPLVPRVDRYAGERRNAFPLTLDPARNQPVWVEVYVPRDAPPGDYSGAARITCH